MDRLGLFDGMSKEEVIILLEAAGFKILPANGAGYIEYADGRREGGNNLSKTVDSNARG